MRILETRSVSRPAWTDEKTGWRQLPRLPRPGGSLETVMIKGVHHTCITVSDLERSIAFYRDVLGLELVMTEESERSGDDRSKALGVAKAKVKLAILRAGRGPGRVDRVCHRQGPALRSQQQRCRSDAHRLPGGGHRRRVPADAGRTVCVLPRRRRRFPLARWKAGAGPTSLTQMVCRWRSSRQFEVKPPEGGAGGG